MQTGDDEYLAARAAFNAATALYDAAYEARSNTPEDIEPEVESAQIFLFA